jgi:hypothetical protein
VKPCELDTTVWKVCRVGREIKADWLVIQRWRTESKVFANTIRCIKSIRSSFNMKCGVTCPVSEPYLEDGSIFLSQRSSHFGMTVSKLQQVTEERYSRNFREILDLGHVCAVHIFKENVDDCDEDEARDLVRHDGHQATMQLLAG